VLLPRWLARANKAGLNRAAKHVVPWLPPFALVVHHGRKSGRRYETPVMVFRDGDQFLIALTYGGDHTDWVKNVVAADGCELRTGGRVYRTGAPRIYRTGAPRVYQTGAPRVRRAGAARICQDKFRSGIRPLERQVLRLLGTTDFLSLTITH